MYVCIYAYKCIVPVEITKKLELQTVVSHHVGAGIRTLVHSKKQPVLLTVEPSIYLLLDFLISCPLFFPDSSLSLYL